MSDTLKLVEWRGDEDPERVEAATLALSEDRLNALGTSRTADYVVGWSLRTGPGWVTSQLIVAVFGRGFARRLALTRDAEGRWSSEVSQEGLRSYNGERLDDPGIGDPESLDGADDCDLALCPVTNTMPILRLGAHRQAVAESAFIMAWVALPSLAVVRSEQFYSSGPDAPEAGQAVVRYESGDRGFRSELTVDPDGVVIDYPQIARRIRPNG
ncbi:hypothetical protein A0130_03870 [Leifsonia xyli]|uniref:putative glycolipid-binding domain-containing protein n=1 Tax=Leifsonia xyli TaxID=1575 RepID=UPI0007CDA418|nr:hypothetical protein A0130_03870 [Leifsonia xyli]